MAKIQIDVPGEKISAFCRKWKVRELSLFGSVLQENFGPDSDVDIVVEFEASVTHSLLDMVSMKEELEEIFGREVDLMTRQAVEQSRNYIRRKAIMSSIEVIYVA